MSEGIHGLRYPDHRLTKREQFAAVAMQAILTSYDEPVEWLVEGAVASRAFRMADAMLAESEGTQG